MTLACFACNISNLHLFNFLYVRILLVASVILMVNIEVYYHIAAQPMNVTQIQEAHVLVASSSRILILHIHGPGGRWELLPGVPWEKRTMLDVLMNVLNTSQTFTLERWW